MEFTQIFQFLVLLVLLLVPIFTYRLFRKYFRGLSGFVLTVVVSALIMSFVVIVRWLGYDWYLEQQIAPLDRNSDGFWTLDEEATWTEQDFKNMSIYIGDGGGNVFAIFIYPAFSLLYSTLIVSLYWLVNLIQFKRTENA